MASDKTKKGGLIAGAGCLFGLAPLIISFIALAFGSDIGGTLHWATFMTAPIGAVVVIVGLIMAIIGANKSTAADFAESTTLSQGKASAGEPATPTGLKQRELPPLPSGLARTVKIAYASGFVVLLVSCGMRVTIFQPFSGILTLFDLTPVFFAGWFVYLARNVQDGLQFLRLYQSQLIVSIAGCVAGLWPLVTMDTSLSLLKYEDVPSFQMVGTLITGFIPAVASLASLIFAGVVRAIYRRGVARG
ncbi:MAG: hypothetical protein ACOYNK_04230 [Microbacteriaceae bacterium]